MTHWVRLWEDMPTDPKWRVVARRSGRPLSEVLSVFVFMMTNAGANATERGRLQNWSDEDVAAALDMDGEHVTLIREAMAGKTLEGDRLTGWERRQPKREDNSAERAKAWREAHKRKQPEQEQTERARTQPNASERPDKNRIDTDKSSSLRSEDSPATKKQPAKRKQRISEAQLPVAADVEAATRAGLNKATMIAEWQKFRDYHLGKGSLMLDWSAAWRTWLGRMQPRARAGPYPEKRDPVIQAGLELMEEYRRAEVGPELTDDYAECAPVERIDWRSAG